MNAGFVFIDDVACVGGLICFHDARRLPGAFAGRQDGRRLCLRPVETQHEIDGVVRRGQPVSFLLRAGTVLSDVERRG